jgi:subtilisin family serine protease
MAPDRLRRMALVMLTIATGLLTCVPAATAAENPPVPTPANPSADRGEDPRSGDITVPGQYIVILEDDVDHPRATARAQLEQHGGRLGFVYRSALKGYSARLSDAAVDALRRNPLVRAVRPDRELQATAQTIPTGISRVRATANAIADIDEQNDVEVNVDVAVIDTGVANHDDLIVWERTYCNAQPTKEEEEKGLAPATATCVNNTGTATGSHATHVAGTIAARDNGFGVVGMAPGARIWSVKVLDPGGWESEIVAGIDWVTARSKQIEVANMSIGCTCEKTPAISEAINSAVNAGVVFVVSAGNDGVSVKWNGVAATPAAITVSALADYDGQQGGKAVPLSNNGNKPEEYCKAQQSQNNYGEDDVLAWFSNNGAGVDLAAPGVCILSTVPSETGESYGLNSGTSMAAPHVAGAAALLASQANPENKEDVESITKQLKDEGAQNWTDAYLWAGGELVPGEFLPGADWYKPDGVQEPLLDVGPAGAATYTTRAIKKTPRSAVLNGGINPNGASSTYQFELGPTTSYGSAFPSSPGSVAAGMSDVKVTAQAENLKPDTLYHYRLVSIDGKGSKTFGEDQVFRTPISTFTLPAVSVSAKGARLKGQVNPDGAATSYQFEWGTTSGYGNAIPSSPQSAGSGTGLKVVGTRLEGLKPGYTYHYRLLTTSTAGTFYGQDQAFTTETKGIKAEAYPAEAKPSTGQLEVQTRVGAERGESLRTTCQVTLGNDQLTQAQDHLALGLESTTCAQGGSTATLKPNGCQFIFYPGSESASEDVGSLEIGGTACAGSITIDGPTCDIALPAQGGIPTTIRNKKTTSGDNYVSLFALGEGLEYVQEGSLCQSRATGFLRLAEADVFATSGGSPVDLTVARIWPVVKTGQASVITSSSVKTTGEIDTKELAGSYWFEYGSSASYGSQTSKVTFAAGLKSALQVETTVANLKASVLHHYRLVAEVDGERAYGDDRTVEIHDPRFEAGSYPAAISGLQSGEHVLQFKTSTLKCTGASAAGQLTAAGSSVSLTPAYSGCTLELKSGGTLSATVNSNSCALELHARGEWLAGHSGVADVDCPSGQAIEVLAGTCKVKVFGAAEVKSTDYADGGTGVEAHLRLSGLEHSEIDGLACPFAATVTSSEGSYKGDFDLEAADGSAQPIALAIDGLEVQPHAPAVEAQLYPAVLTGSQGEGQKHELKFDGATLSCTTATVTGGLTQRSQSVLLSPTYSGCSMGGSAATVTTNGCGYEVGLAVSGAGPVYGGLVGVVCPEGKKLTVTAGTCKVELASQAGLTGADLSTDVQSSRERLLAEFDLSGISYTQTDGFLCSLNGSGSRSGGTYSGNSLISAENAWKEATAVRVASIG